MFEETNYVVAYAALLPADFTDNQKKFAAVIDYLDRTFGRVVPEVQTDLQELMDSPMEIEQQFKQVSLFGDTEGFGDLYITTVWAGESPELGDGVPLADTFASLTEQKKAEFDQLAALLGTTPEWTLIRNTLV